MTRSHVRLTAARSRPFRIVHSIFLAAAAIGASSAFAADATGPSSNRGTVTVTVK